MQRHQVHHKSIRGKFEKIFTKNIDRKINNLIGRLSLRDMILRIKSTDPTKKGARLFQSIDFIEDASKVYFQHNKKNGPECEGHIFQYYQSMENEALAMVRGLGIYLNKEYGEESTANKLSVTHWNENIGWDWNTERKCFITPDEKLVQDLIQLDANVNIIDVEATMMMEEEQQKLQSNTADRMIQQQENKLIQLLRNPDLDPISRLDQPVNDPVEEVTIPPSDNVSTTSTLTDQESAEINEITETLSTVTPQRNNGNHMTPRRSTSSQSISSSSTNTSGRTSSMRHVIDPNLSLQENRRRLIALSAVKRQRLQQKQEKLLAELEQLELAGIEETDKEESDNRTNQDTNELNNDTNEVNRNEVNRIENEQTASGLTAGNGP